MPIDKHVLDTNAEKQLS